MLGYAFPFPRLLGPHKNFMPASSYIPNLTGCTIGHGHLKLLDVLGSGSSGVVYLAEDTTISAEFPPQYAVKCMLKPEEGSARDDAQRNEIYNHMLVSDHPNIVTLHGVIVDSDLSLVFLILDYCPGGDLFKLVLEGRITPGDDIFVRRTLLQLMDALDACHQQGVFHRDVKLENIMCSTDGSRMFLCDFGMSTRHSYSTSFGAGSHLYMSPECIGNYSSHPYSTRANDVWALGVIMTAMITEHNPWRKAIMEDGCYRAYQKDGEYLRKSLPISSGASIILQRIFTQESNRITVPYLRLIVLRTDTFFAPEACMLRVQDFSIEKRCATCEGEIEKRELDIEETDIAERFMGTVLSSIGSGEITEMPRTPLRQASDGATQSTSDSGGLKTQVLGPAVPVIEIRAEGESRPVVSRRSTMKQSLSGLPPSGLFRRLTQKLYLC